MEEQTVEGYWLTPLRQTSNPYKTCPDHTPCHSTEFTSTFVGDEYDTSPYTDEDPELCISVRTYIDNLARMIYFLDSKKQK